MDESGSDTMQYFAEDALIISSSDGELMLNLSNKLMTLLSETGAVVNKLYEVTIDQIQEKNAARAAQN